MFFVGPVPLVTQGLPSFWVQELRGKTERASVDGKTGGAACGRILTHVVEAAKHRGPVVEGDRPHLEPPGFEPGVAVGDPDDVVPGRRGPGDQLAGQIEPLLHAQACVLVGVRPLGGQVAALQVVMSQGDVQGGVVEHPGQLRGDVDQGSVGTAERSCESLHAGLLRSLNSCRSSALRSGGQDRAVPNDFMSGSFLDRGPVARLVTAAVVIPLPDRCVRWGWLLGGRGPGGWSDACGGDGVAGADPWVIAAGRGRTAGPGRRRRST